MKTLIYLSLSFVWSFTNWIHRLISKPETLGVRVVSVGNIQAGGAGKTPLVVEIAREALERGLRPCILIRGYKSIWEKTGGVLLPQAKTPFVSECGDEAALLHELLPTIPIGVGRNRVESFRKIKALSPVDLVLLDDGFQNHQIKKDLEIVVLTSQRPYERVFRDFFSALKKADLIVWTKGKREPPGWEVQVKFELPNIQNQKKMSTVSPELACQSIFLVTAVGSPSSVYETVLQSGYEIKEHLVFPDHYTYKKEEILKILDQAKKHSCAVALTGKDWVKWKEHGVLLTQVIVLEPKTVFVKGRKLWNQKLWEKSS